ncbi:threonine-phosphate decarboxylase CobD [Thermoanaerobacterium sp. DL9XJH110]|uniref:threonine-phosphate decarboxylase CobD n=1 Tax=Thermoanaerobacterium sp. DL9XJH110 TaxID=3386643 RepID=UPI003BB71C0E
MITRFHGGNVYKAAREINIAYRDILDFSANINPLGFPDYVRNIITDHIDDIVYYPDTEQNELKQAAAEYYGTNAENLIPGNGSAELVHIILDVIRPTKVVIPSPTFSEYALTCKSRQIKIELVDMTENDFKWTPTLFDRIKHRVTEKSVLVICNPNNPTGKLTSKEELTMILDELKNRGAYLLIDEAFMDFVEKSQSMVEQIETHQNLIILKSLTKFFALPGLRIGFALACRRIVEKMYQFKDPWNINTFAGFVGAAVLKDKSYIQRTREFISQEKEWLWKELRKVPGLEPFRPEANFIFVRITGGFNASQLAESLKRQGILIRQCSNFEFLNDSFFRVAVKGREANEKLIAALRDFMICSRSHQIDPVLK